MDTQKIFCMTIKTRVMFLSVLVVFCLVLMAAFKIVSDNNQAKLYHADKTISDINAGMLMLRRNEKDFISRLDVKYI